MRQGLHILSFILWSLLSFKAWSYDFDSQAELGVFIKHMAEKHHFSSQALRKLFHEAHKQDKILELIAKPYEAQPWHKYQARFLTPERVQAGVAYWRTHQKALAQVEKRYGVPADIVVAIIGVETFYGRNKGSFPVFDSLATLAFFYPPRASFFKKELEHFLIMAREEKFTPRSLRGSYAGAMGTPQFMPSSYRHYAVKLEGSGPRDLINNDSDAIASVGHYFYKHGWQKNQGVICQAYDPKQNLNDTELASMKNPKPNYSPAKIAAFGVKARRATCVQHQSHLALIGLDLASGSKEYWLGLPNFYVITRYNHSTHYAMAVYQLSEQLRASYSALQP